MREQLRPVGSKLTIRLDDLSGREIVELLEHHLRDFRAVTPAESFHALDLEALRRPDVTFWSAWLGPSLAGCGALKLLGDGEAEIKSMRTVEAYRGRGVASAILSHILGEARRLGCRRVNLETGSGEAFAPARRLYEKFGFRSCPPFGDYTNDPNSAFFSLWLGRLE